MIKPFVKVSAHGFIKKGNKFLVTQRPLDDDYMPGYWDTPGGTINFGEKAVDALKREIKEETNLDVKIGNIIYCYDYISEIDPNRHQFQMVFECEYISGEVILDPKEHQQFKWVTPDELKDLPKITFLKNFYQDYLQK